MSTPGLLLCMLALGAPPGGSVASSLPTARDILNAESSKHKSEVKGIVASLVAADDALISAGFEDPVRHRRINRLLGLGSAAAGAGYESTAVAAACLDLLTTSRELRRNTLFPDLHRAARHALHALLPLIPGSRLPVAGEYLEIGRGADFLSVAGETPRLPSPSTDRGPHSPPAGSGLRPLVSPLSPAGRSPAGSVFLEGDSLSSIDIPGPDAAGYRWLPGSRRILLWSGARVHEVDPVTGATKDLGDRDPNIEPSVSASGEYLAVVVGDDETGQAVRLLRLGETASWESIDAGERIGALSFAPRGLKLAYLADGRVMLHDVAEVRTREVFRPAQAAASWSPDGRKLLILEAAGGAARVIDVERPPPGSGKALPGRRAGPDEEPLEIDAPASLLRWNPDSRSLSGLSHEPRPDGRISVILRRRTLEEPSAGGERRPGPGHGPADAPAVTLFDTASDEYVSDFAWAPDGRHLLFRIRRNSPSGDPLSSPDGLDPGAFSPWSSSIRIVTLSGGPESSLDPAGIQMPDADWHPSSRWYAATYEGPAFGSAVWVHDIVRGDAFPLGSPLARHPRFSPDGRRLAFLDGEPGRERLCIRNLTPAPPNLPRGRTEAARGAQALRKDDPAEAILRFRNAVRLAPDRPRHFQGLGRAYLAMAARSPGAHERASYIEAASRAFASAFELAGSEPDIRVDFLDAMARRAILTGRMLSQEASREAERMLKNGIPPDEPSRRRFGRRVIELLVEASLWDPWNEYHRILLEGVAARFGEPRDLEGVR